MSEPKTGHAPSVLQEQLSMVEAFADAAGIDLLAAEFCVDLGTTVTLTTYRPEKVRAQLLAALGEPKREQGSVLRAAVWAATLEHPFSVRAYYWFKDEHCSTCGR